MTAFTRLGSSVWDWEPFVELARLERGDQVRLFWLSLYTTAHARRNVVGLWQGGIPVMADGPHMQPDDVRSCLDILLDRDLVEYDPKTKVLRLCALPDPGEYPSNGKVIKSWWTRFQTVPECQVRDAHVRTLRWILDEGARLSQKVVSPDHEDAWRTTFGTVHLPAVRKRGIRRLCDSDTGTGIQPSLFPDSANALPSWNGIGASEGSAHPQVLSQAVDNSASLRQSNKINSPETVSDTVSDTNRIPDPGSRIPDLSSSFPERGMGGGHENGMRPVLSLVPPFGARDVLERLALGPWDKSLDLAYQDALGALIPFWASRGWGLDEFDALADYNRHSGRTWNARLLVGCDMAKEITVARRGMEWRDIRKREIP